MSTAAGPGADQRTALEALLRRHVEEGTVPGAVALLGGEDAEPVAVGRLAVDGPAMPVDAVVRLQSMTKVVTAVAALRAVEAGHLGLDDAVERWLPELADRRVLRHPAAEVDDTVPAPGPITLRHLLTCTSGYGMVVDGSPLGAAMAANGTQAGPLPWAGGADAWLARLAALPLAFAPGTGWRYHHSFSVLGVLLARVAGRPLADHLAADLLGPLGLRDTGFWVPTDRLDRLPAAYRAEDGALVETEPAGGGPYAGPPDVDVSHGELVSTAADYHRFLRALAARTPVDGAPLLSAEHLALLTSDQVAPALKTPESFFPGFWDGTGWGFGVAVVTAGPAAGRYGWSGGQGTDFFVDPDGTTGILLTQVELGERTWGLLQDFQALRDPDRLS
ncbi:serine hydrolase domain-containing protein [Microlunatus capsulatus]|uniref:CubicO group peptidase (Beta-lactamase class C family) n=1 Tax=Microlunatus capsulatus TaxID=99117 RepID=A0ABS4Z347_9ACTN|nr:serine hydrolase domain-containing protein [Microlunatus capsulatus]MBP2415160.1 CubicO group peptidase (beta-lactamase class C family) [Microlunatus capsulatus]